MKIETSADLIRLNHVTTVEITGFDIALANYIADKLEAELKINDMKFNGLTGALQRLFI